jgi:alpha/beta superfamily hydrolase
MTLPPLEPFAIDGPAGRLDGRLELPDPVRHPAPRFLAVFGHPHPQHGGTMQNSVVVHGARALAAAGLAVARFDFRGVGKSAGRYDEGRGELADYRAVATFLRARFPRAEALLAAGFSFGAIRALELTAAGEADAWLGVAPPITLAKYGGQVPERVVAPSALVLAGADELVVAPTRDRLATLFTDLRAVEVVAGAGHLFFGRIREVAAAVARAAAALGFRDKAPS